MSPPAFIVRVTCSGTDRHPHERKPQHVLTFCWNESRGWFTTSPSAEAAGDWTDETDPGRTQVVSDDGEKIGFHSRHMQGRPSHETYRSRCRECGYSFQRRGSRVLVVLDRLRTATQHAGPEFAISAQHLDRLCSRSR